MTEFGPQALLKLYSGWDKKEVVSWLKTVADYIDSPRFPDSINEFSLAYGVTVDLGKSEPTV